MNGKSVVRDREDFEFRHCSHLIVSKSRLILERRSSMQMPTLE
jgi:hypothetical protein